MNITILGAGNVATQLSLAFRKAGHAIVQIFNRSGEAGELLAKTVGADFVSDASQLKDADIYLIAVKDDAIADVASQLKTNGKIVAHTSGSKTKDLLRFSSANYGIFYPLQTLTKSSKVTFSDVPVLIEGSNKTTTEKLEELALTLSKNIHRVDEQQRQWIHVAAVIANNFTNHLFTLSEDLLKKHGADFNILKPLIFRAVENLRETSPSQLQTGPAMRKDRLTVERHLNMLNEDKHLQKIYEVINDSITRRHIRL